MEQYLCNPDLSQTLKAKPAERFASYFKTLVLVSLVYMITDTVLLYT